MQFKHSPYSLPRLLPLLLFGISGQAMALSAKEQKASLTKAQKAFEQGNCIDAVLESAGTALSENTNGQLARFYIARCQNLLGDPASSYKTALSIDKQKLDKEQKTELLDLIAKLEAVPSAKSLSFGLGAGLLGYDNDKTFDRGTFFDVNASYNSKDISVAVGAESVSIDQKTGATYTQTHWLALGELRVLDSIGLKSAYRKQKASSSTIDDSSNAIVGARWFNSVAQVGASYIMSQYPNYYPGELAINQSTAHGSYTIGSAFDTGALTLDLKLHRIIPDMKYNPRLTNSDALEDAYSSMEGTLRYSHSSWSFAITNWFGEQVFAVLADGFLVYSNSTVHTGGVKLSADYFYQDIGSIGVLYGLESLKDISTGKVASSSVTSLNASLYF